METNHKKRSLIGKSLSFAFDALIGNIGAWIVMLLTMIGFAVIGWLAIAALAMVAGAIGCVMPIPGLSLMTGEAIYQCFKSHDASFTLSVVTTMTLFYLIYAESMMLGILHSMIQFYNTGEIKFRPYLKFDAIVAFIVAGLIVIPLISVGLILLLVPGIIVMIRSFFMGFYIVDKNMGPIEAIKASWELTRGKSSIMLGLILIGLLLNFIPVIGWLATSLMAVYVYKILSDGTPLDEMI